MIVLLSSIYSDSIIIIHCMYQIFQSMEQTCRIVMYHTAHCSFVPVKLLSINLSPNELRTELRHYLLTYGLGFVSHKPLFIRGC